ncbi:MAG: DUF488 family protein [Nitrospirae bacterium]|nr:DUF488 family protein [Nitrospirota bacterium]MBI5694597.1 DUF488 family protein [Nitrospirota bacterium]
MVIHIKRAYDPPEGSDGARILVDRLWPRGLKKEDAAIRLWLKDIAPSEKLRKWFGHDPARWNEFQDRYFRELDRRDADEVGLVIREAERAPVTLVYAARDERYNNAAALKSYIEERAMVKKAA